MNRSELIVTLREAAERNDREASWNHDTMQVTAIYAASNSLRAVADLLAEGVGNEAR